MFSSNWSNEFLVDENQTYQDLMIWLQDGDTLVDAAGVSTHPSTTDMVKSFRTKAKRPRLLCSRKTDGNKNDDANSKKVSHREIERQRRQEMAALYASLRILLPLECIKGKRSVSDHMDGAVNYIKHLENRISGLRATRDELNKLSFKSSSGTSVLDQENANVIESWSSSTKSSDNRLPTCSVTVRPCSGGIEILCSSGFRGRGLMTLSRMLQVIIDEGIAVISCVSTKVDHKFLYTINTEVCDLTCLDFSGLQQQILMELAP